MMITKKFNFALAILGVIMAANSVDAAHTVGPHPGVVLSGTGNHADGP